MTRGPGRPILDTILTRAKSHCANTATSVAPAPWGTCPPTFTNGSARGHRRQRLITAMQCYANSTVDCRTEIKFYLEIRTTVQKKP